MRRQRRVFEATTLLAAVFGEVGNRELKNHDDGFVDDDRK